MRLAVVFLKSKQCFNAIHNILESHNLCINDRAIDTLIKFLYIPTRPFFFASKIQLTRLRFGIQNWMQEPCIVVPIFAWFSPNKLLILIGRTVNLDSFVRITWIPCSVVHLQCMRAHFNRSSTWRGISVLQSRMTYVASWCGVCQYWN